MSFPLQGPGFRIVFIGAGGAFVTPGRATLPSVWAGVSEMSPEDVSVLVVLLGQESWEPGVFKDTWGLLPWCSLHMD